MLSVMAAARQAAQLRERGYNMVMLTIEDIANQELPKNTMCIVCGAVCDSSEVYIRCKRCDNERAKLLSQVVYIDYDDWKRNHIKDIKCAKCNMINEYIINGNQQDGSYICYNCR